MQWKVCAGLFLVEVSRSVRSSSGLCLYHGVCTVSPGNGHRTAVAAQGCWGLNAERSCPPAAISELLIRMQRLDGEQWNSPMSWAGAHAVSWCSAWKTATTSVLFLRRTTPSPRVPAHGWKVCLLGWELQAGAGHGTESPRHPSLEKLNSFRFAFKV